jgi:adenine deaminase
MANVLIGGGLILGVGPACDDAPAVHDLDGAIVLPGLIDGHVHLESSFLTPARFAEAVVPHGTTTVVADPHEIANVLGVEGIRWMRHACAGLPLEVLLMAPSCVPASSLETPGARLDATSIAEILRWEGVVGLAEMMDVAGVLAENADVMRKLEAARRLGRPVDGHAPGLTGRALNAYLAAGVESDHECVTLAEAREKLALGMRIMIREGSQARNLRDLLPAVDATSVRRCLLVSDDRNVVDLLADGHVDHLLRRAVALGVPPLWAVQMVTLNAAEHVGLRRLGAVAPGRQADLVVVEDLAGFRCSLVFKAGRLVAEGGALVAAVPPTPSLRSTMNVAPLTLEMLRIPDGRGHVRVVELVPGQIGTREILAAPRRGAGTVVADPERDLAKLVVVERHRRTGRVGRGLVRGFHLERGALAASVAHDSHHLIGVGVDDGDLLLALSEVAARAGGLAVAAGGEVRASLPLPVAGLMSDAPLGETARGLAKVEAEARALGVAVEHPFGALSFLALPVVPALRVTDLGLVDATRHCLVPLFVET